MSFSAKYAFARAWKSSINRLGSNSCSASNSVISGCCLFAPTLAVYFPKLSYAIGFCVKPAALAASGGVLTLILISEMQDTALSWPTTKQHSRRTVTVRTHFPRTGSLLASWDSSDESALDEHSSSPIDQQVAERVRRLKEATVEAFNCYKQLRPARHGVRRQAFSAADLFCNAEFSLCRYGYSNLHIE